MAASVYRRILDKVKSIVEALELVGVQQVLVRKLPRSDEAIDTDNDADAALAIVVVAPNDAEQVRHMSFEGVNVVYTVDVVAITGGGLAKVATLDVLDWRERIRRAFQGDVLSGVSEVWKTEMVPDPAYNRDQLNRNYDYSGLRVRFHAYESRTND